MLFSIYSASLIALSSAMRVGSPAGQTDCKLSVAVDGVGMGWVQATEDDILTTTGTESKTFEDGTLFKYGVGKENGSFRVLQTQRESGAVKEVVLNGPKEWLFLRDPGTKGYIGTGWVAPKTDSGERPTELIIQDIETKEELPVQYCTLKSGSGVPVLSVVGDRVYECKKATIFVRFIYTSVETFPQKAKIAVYKKKKLDYMGWLFVSKDSMFQLYDDYDKANEFSLQGEAGNMKIYMEKQTIRKSDPTGPLGIYENGDSQIFQWANGNSQQILPSGATTLYHCTNENRKELPIFRTEKPTAKGFECVEVLWILSVIG